MSRRGRALTFLVLAMVAAASAAAIANGYGSRIARGYGPLRPVVVLESALPAGQRFGPEEISAALEVRRVPERFAPAGALAVPAEALGLVSGAPLPAGSYLLAAQLRAPKRDGRRRGRLGGNRGPVEISVSGADALFETVVGGGEPKVDVIVTREPTGAGPGRTYVAAEDVPLLALRPGIDGPGPQSAATLGLTRRQALRLISAESFARKLTLLAAG
jgi:Flp pilus assembly protein CpaB